ncbi:MULTISPECIES: preprotein translocase subunit SecG [Marinifilum]|uniref:Protein-export membrane protein SecG n=1 Tax=Marinifilum flexuosum TaxID=1117708 RepID=A0A419WL13_9BACT|nr:MULTISPECIES: preprotein translocase subunit SecG [Marinifilum]MCY1636538.1 preprotein translocase subunit SecG [Marinifilum sp. D737]MDQ2179766.1 preprotein translocase subunit SecG [Marinifilum sp. D714]RKD96114.1 protein translocase subunit secG [Marinifilum flexuosum]
MYTFVSVLILIVCVLLILIVLVQNSKGGGLASNFSSSNQIMGVKKTTDFLEKATWTLAGGLLFLCLVAAVTIPREEIREDKSQIEQQLNETETTPEMPAFPTDAAATEQDTAK